MCGVTLQGGIVNKFIVVGQTGKPHLASHPATFLVSQDAILCAAGSGKPVRLFGNANTWNTPTGIGCPVAATNMRSNCVHQSGVQVCSDAHRRLGCQGWQQQQHEKRTSFMSNHEHTCCQWGMPQAKCSSGVSPLTIVEYSKQKPGSSRS